MRTYLTIVIVVLTLGFVAGCRKQTAKKEVANSATPSPTDAPVGGGTVQTGQKFFFRGTIGDSIPIEMSLLRDGEHLTGTYFYPRVGKNIALTGTVDKSGSVSLTEADDSGKQTGTFKGKWQSRGDSPDSNLNEIDGQWSKPDGSKQTDFIVWQQPFEFGDTVRVVPKVIKEANKEKLYTVDAEYPQMDGDTRFDGFNREARSLIVKDVAAFKTAETQEEGETPSDMPAETQNSTLHTRYSFQYATNDLISLEFIESAYSRGAAHGNYLTEVLNYDVKNGKKLALADLFNPKSKYLSVISDYCIKELKNRAKNQDSMIFADQLSSNAGPHADNYRAWSITKKGLWITFDPYQVAAYAAGPQYVLVPYSTLKDVIKPDGPIGNLAQ